MKEIRLAILASGSGSTGEVLFDKAVVVVTNNPDVGVIERAKKRNIPCLIRMRKDYQTDGKNDPQKYGEELIRIFSEYKVDFVSQNGWSLLTPLNVINAFENRIVNSHPGPLDPGHTGFGGKGMHGLAVHAAVINFARALTRPFSTEVTIHHVWEEYDKGPLLAYTAVEILPEDSPETLQDRVKEIEKKQNKEFWQKVAEIGYLPEPIERETRLILDDEKEILAKAIEDAIAKYPHG